MKMQTEKTSRILWIDVAKGSRLFSSSLLNQYVTSSALVKYGLLAITIILITRLKNRIKTIISLVPVSKGW